MPGPNPAPPLVERAVAPMSQRRCRRGCRSVEQSLQKLVLLPVTALYAGLLALILLPLSARVIGIRRRQRISLLDGADPRLTRAIRAHGNFIEYVPIALILMLVDEINGAAAWLLHPLGLLLLGGRLAHAYALTTDPRSPLRVAGMGCTLTAIGLGGGLALWQVAGAL